MLDGAVVLDPDVPLEIRETLLSRGVAGTGPLYLGVADPTLLIR